MRSERSDRFTAVVLRVLTRVVAPRSSGLFVLADVIARAKRPDAQGQQAAAIALHRQALTRHHQLAHAITNAFAGPVASRTLGP